MKTVGNFDRSYFSRFLWTKPERDELKNESEIYTRETACLDNFVKKFSLEERAGCGVMLAKSQ